MSVENASTERVRVALGERAYDILVGEGLLAHFSQAAGAMIPTRRCAIVTDETVAGHHLDPLRASLSGAGIEANAIVLPPGEHTKCFAAFESLVSRLLDLGIERGDTVIALGGGVIGDLTGFAAAILRRGVGFLQCPTTLLAQVDSSVGGKTGINMPQGKNLVGAFYQPRGVIADLTTLDTLPQRERLAGYAEIVKYGLIDRPAFFDWLEAHGERVLAGERDAQRYAIAESCRAKAAVVAADEREAGRRALLNLGHTFGHALEAVCGYDSRLLHGEAVSMGLVMAFELSVRLGHARTADAERLRRHLETVGLPVRPAAHLQGEALDLERVVDAMGQDKKVKGGIPTFVLLRGIGQAFLSREVPRTTLMETLKTCLA